ncbi:response regulator [Oleiharenicola lentus]|uniref:response regulator n=1 Tax=Oleiharenicola lentus TaxID=2508720 RepID=UPI003F6683D0
MSQPAPVIYVEDTEDDVFLMRRSFTKAHMTHPLVVMPNGREAITHLESLVGHGPSHPKMPCLILIDVKMPFVNGLELLSWIRARQDFRHVPVVMFSSSSQKRDIDAARSRGANGYVVKPSNLDELRALIEALRPVCTALVASDAWVTLPGSISEDAEDV